MFQISDGRRVEVRFSEQDGCTDIVVVHTDGTERVRATFNGRNEATRDYAATYAMHLANRIELG